MTEIGAYDAKTNLSKLLERVEKGERFVITKHGRPIAELAPVSTRDPHLIERAIEELKSFQQKHSLKGDSIRDLLEEGRKY